MGCSYSKSTIGGPLYPSKEWKMDFRKYDNTVTVLRVSYLKIFTFQNQFLSDCFLLISNNTNPWSVCSKVV